MGGEGEGSRRLLREARYAEIVSARARGDVEFITDAMRPDVVIELAGSSSIAGAYRGYEGFEHYVAAMGSTVRSAGKPMRFEHEGEVLVVHQVGALVGTGEFHEMPFRIRIRFDADERISHIQVEPEDPDVFDRVVDARPSPPMT
jgi:ketosteroid isomerase-like protein